MVRVSNIRDRVSVNVKCWAGVTPKCRCINYLNKQLDHHSSVKCCCCLFSRVSLYGLFTPPMRTRQNCLVLSAVVFTPPTWQDKTVCRVSNCVHTAHWNWVEMRQNCLVGGVNKPLRCGLSPSTRDCKWSPVSNPSPNPKPNFQAVYSQSQYIMHPCGQLCV